MGIIKRVVYDWDLDKRFYVKTAPAIEPVTLGQLKIFARIDGAAEDPLLLDYIQAARESLEKWLGRSFISQTLILSIDEWPCGPVRLPQLPVQSITEVREIDEDGNTEAYSSDDYYLRNTSRMEHELVMKTDFAFPTTLTDLRAHGGIEIEYLAGYGATAASVPSNIQHGILLWATAIYESRTIDRDNPPPSVMSILQGPEQVVMV